MERNHKLIIITDNINESTKNKDVINRYIKNKMHEMKTNFKDNNLVSII